MTLAELKNLLALLEKAQAHAERQADYLPDGQSKFTWGKMEHDCLEALVSIQCVVDMIERAMNDEEN